eukprot:scaffold214183_cov16-Tisochrysis_lutea.AAC.1
MAQHTMLAIGPLPSQHTWHSSSKTAPAQATATIPSTCPIHIGLWCGLLTYWESICKSPRLHLSTRPGHSIVICIGYVGTMNKKIKVMCGLPSIAKATYTLEQGIYTQKKPTVQVHTRVSPARRVSPSRH